MGRKYIPGRPLSRSQREAMRQFRYQRKSDAGMLTGTELLNGYGITPEMERRVWGNYPSTFFQNVNCGSGVIRR